MEDLGAAMTPGAGERARELWEQIQDLTDYDETLRVLAGALAAVRLEEARWWDENVGEYDRFEEAAERLLALERAVEGK